MIKLSYSERRNLTTEEKFWRQTDKRGPDDCWNWLGHCSCGGRRPTIVVDGEQIRAAKFIYEKVIGPVSPGLCILHRCDNPKCVNPNHLFVGTQLDNIQDMKNKGRANKPVGESNGRAILTEDDVRFIRMNWKFRSKDYSQKALAKRFNVSVTQIQMVLYRRQWTHV